MSITVGGTSITFNDATVQTTAPVSYTGRNFQSFTASGTFTVPAGITAVAVTVVGGGGGGGGTSQGGNGGTSSFGTYAVSGYGGGGGYTVSCPGSPEGNYCANTGNNANAASTYSAIGPAANYPRKSGSDTSGWGAGGANGSRTISPCGVCYGNGGNNGDNITSWVTGLTPGASITITVGGGGGVGGNGGAGAAGCVVVSW